MRFGNLEVPTFRYFNISGSYNEFSQEVLAKCTFVDKEEGGEENG